MFIWGKLAETEEGRARIEAVMNKMHENHSDTWKKSGENDPYIDNEVGEASRHESAVSCNLHVMTGRGIRDLTGYVAGLLAAEFGQNVEAVHNNVGYLFSPSTGIMFQQIGERYGRHCASMSMANQDLKRQIGRLKGVEYQ